MALSGCRENGRACPLRPDRSDINLFGYGQGIIDFNAQVSDAAFGFRVAEEQLDGSQVARTSIDQGNLGPAE